MPWDGTELMLGGWDFGGTVLVPQRIAGGPQESIFQPEWSPKGELYFVSDRTGWWNLYRWRKGQVEAVREMEADFGMPQWVFGMSTYAFLDEHHILCSFIERGLPQLGILNTSRHSLKRLKSDYAKFDSVRATQGVAVFIAASQLEPTSVVVCDPAQNLYQTLRSSSEIVLSPPSSV